MYLWQEGSYEHIMKATELEYLQYFYSSVRPCLGPADDDIVSSIKQNFKEDTGKQLPEGYELEEDEDES